MLAVAPAADSRARARPARRTSGGHRRRSLRHAGHYQPPQDRSSLEDASHLSGHGHVVRRAPDRLCSARSAARPIPGTGAPAPAPCVEADGSTILIDTPPELRLQLIARRRLASRRGGLHSRARRSHQRHRRSADVLGAARGARCRCTARPKRSSGSARLPVHLRRSGTALRGHLETESRDARDRAEPSDSQSPASRCCLSPSSTATSGSSAIGSARWPTSPT